VTAKSVPIRTRVSKNQITISTNFPWNSSEVQRSALKACERALKEEAKQILPQRITVLANLYGFRYSSIKIIKLSSRWGSCSSKGVITLGYFLIQLPQEMIDYVIMHELVHTRHMHHGKAFWDELSKVVPGARRMKKEIHQYKPRVEPKTTIAIG
jgi:predicted metal-dependent hydrolase